MTAPSPRRSAAAARRLREQASTPRTRPTAPPEAHAGFRPQGSLAQAWDVVGPATVQIVTAAGLTGTESYRKHLTHVGYFLAWANAEGHPVEPGTMRRDLTDEYTRIGMPDSTAKSRTDRRARLRRIADKINPDLAPDRGLVVARPSVKPPYTADEITRIAWVAVTQPTASQRRKLSLCVGLGAGAGLDSLDIRHLRRRDITIDERNGVTVEVGGSRPRTVAVLRTYETLVADGLRDLAPEDLVLGTDEHRRTIAARAIADATVLGDCPRIEQSRLRSTWLAHLLTHRVPVALVLHSAGLTSGRTLGDLLPYLPEITASAAVLRDPSVTA